MKKILFAFLPFALIMILSFSKVADRLPIGSDLPMPTLKMKNIDGKEVSLKDATLKNGLLVMFTCNTCPWVIKNQSRTRGVRKYALENNIGVILLNPNEALRDKDDSFEAMQAYAKDQGWDGWNYVVDKNSVMADEFVATRTPEIFLFNKKGKLVYHGAIDNNPGDADGVTRKHLIIAIDEMLQGKDVSVKETKSVGCTIKRKS